MIKLLDKITVPRGMPGVDRAKLKNRRARAGCIQAACPACREKGADRQGTHLRVFPDGRFGCAVDRSHEHRKRVWELLRGGVKRGEPLSVGLRKPISKNPSEASEGEKTGRIGRLFLIHARMQFSTPPVKEKGVCNENAIVRRHFKSLPILPEPELGFREEPAPPPRKGAWDFSELWGGREAAG